MLKSDFAAWNAEWAPDETAAFVVSKQKIRVFYVEFSFKSILNFLLLSHSVIGTQLHFGRFENDENGTKSYSVNRLTNTSKIYINFWHVSKSFSLTAAHRQIVFIFYLLSNRTKQNARVIREPSIVCINSVEIFFSHFFEYSIFSERAWKEEKKQKANTCIYLEARTSSKISITIGCDFAGMLFVWNSKENFLTFSPACELRINVCLFWF